jgi:hypothetical protein
MVRVNGTARHVKIRSRPYFNVRLRGKTTPTADWYDHCKRVGMRSIRASYLLPLAPLLFGCSTTLSTLQPAETVGQGKFHVGVGGNVNIPVSGIVRVIDESASTASSLSKDSHTPTPAEQRALFNAALGLGLNPPGVTPDVMVRYGIVDEVDVGLRYSGTAIHADAKAMLYHEDPYSISVSLGYSRQRYSGTLFDALDYLNIGDYSRNNIELPVLFGVKLKDYGHVWAGPKVIGSFYSLDASLKRVGVVEHSGGFISYVGGVTGIAVGYKYVFLMAELTGMYMFAKPTIAGQQVDLGGLVLMPSFGAMARF